MFVGNERQISMNKDDLLNKLIVNLADHKAAVTQAVKAWEDAALAYATKLLKEVKSGNYANLGTFFITKPVDNSAEIERAIAMVKASVEEVIVLDEQTFSRWVMGEWEFTKRLQEVYLASSAMGAQLRKR